MVATLAVQTSRFKLRISANLWQNFTDGFPDSTGKSRVAAGYKMMAVVNGGVSGQVVITLAIGPGVDGTEFDAPNGDVFNVCGKAESVLPR